MSAIFLGEIGLFDAATAWLAESERLAAGNIHGASAAVSVAFDRGDMQAATDSALRLVPRQAEERHDFWHNAITQGCLAARELGRGPEFRAALENANALPHDFSPAAFAEWVGPKASPRVRLRQIAGIRRCVFDETPADATRREQLLALMAATFGNDWETHEEWRTLAAELRDDRAAMIAAFVPPQQTSASDLPVRSASAHFLGIDDIGVSAHIADQRAAIEQMRAQLPAVLAKEGLPLQPGSVVAAKAAQPTSSGPE
jgi:hypothetical protein